MSGGRCAAAVTFPPSPSWSRSAPFWVVTQVAAERHVENIVISEGESALVESRLNAVVTRRVDVAPGLMILGVSPNGWDLARFLPGQFAVLGLPVSNPRCALSEPEELRTGAGALIRRSYSIASSDGERSDLEFYITLVRSGTLTPRLFALQVGDRLWLGPKASGLFTLRAVPPDRDLVLVATGTGLAPYMSMLRSDLLNGGPRRIAVIHGARHSWDLGYRAELATLQRLFPRLTYLPVVSRPAEEPVSWGGLTGRVQDVWRAGHLARLWGRPPDPSFTHILLAGNPEMVDHMEALLAVEGYSRHTRQHPGTVHTEKYW
jgi:ferredoxin/flavodoxin---NADP+ reductase